MKSSAYHQKQSNFAAGDPVPQLTDAAGTGGQYDENDSDYENIFVGEVPPKFERSILDPCQQPFNIDSTDTPCHHFFQQQGAIDYKSYIRLKKEERLAIVQYHAAVKIQAMWRGFLIRTNWDIVNAAVLKIQAWIRGHIAREIYRKIVEERDAERLQELREKAAIKIQAAWRGYLSRKNKLDFYKYKDIQAKNEALRRSIERINQLESALLKALQGGRTSEDGSHSGTETPSSSKKNEHPCQELAKTDSRLNLLLENFISPSVEKFMVDKIPEYVNELSENRIAELYAYLANMETEMKNERELEALVQKVGGTHMLTEEQLERLEESRRVQKERAQKILDLSKLVIMGPLKKKLDLEKKRREHLEKDSVESMFPAVPDRPEIVQPDPVKVQALKDAIRLLRQQSEIRDVRDLRKLHVMLRTKTRPGIYSDIYTTELTEIERKLKALKFGKAGIAAEKLARKEKLAEDSRLRRLFAHAVRISNKRRSFEDEEEDEEEEDETAVDEDFMPFDSYGEFEGELGPEDESGSDFGSDETHVSLNPKPPPPTPVVRTYVSDSSSLAGNDEGGKGN